MIEALTREAFAAALRAGLGRACLHVRQFGLSGVADLVLAACLQDQSYDPQCEGGRAPWLYSMFEGTKEYPSFSSSIVAALEQETNTWDSEQLCELAALMGKSGDARAHEALRIRALSHAEAARSDHWVGAEALLSLEGLKAVPDLARRYGCTLRRDPESHPPSLDDLSGAPEFLARSEALLQELAESDSDIGRYLTYWEREKAERAHRARAPKETPEEDQKATRERIRREVPLEKVLLDASTEKGDFPGRYMLFGKSATAEELAAVLQRLEEESVEGVCKRLLWVFRRAAMPEVSPKIWELAASPNGELRAAAIEALAQLQDPRVGELGRRRLRAHRFAEGDSAVLALFIRNYLPGDEDLIMAALQGSAPPPEGAHSLCWGLLDIAEENASVSFLPILNWAYERTPCSNCRRRALKLLRDLGGLRHDIIRECLFDADDGIRQLAEEVQSHERV